jgi:hypothetical protein
MPVRPLMTGIMLVIAVFLLMYMVEFFIPLSAKGDIDMVCRNALLKMENSGGMTASGKQALRSELESMGLENITISATENAKQGGLLTLRVEGDYTYSGITGFLSRGDITIRLVYDKSAMSRKVLN